MVFGWGKKEDVESNTVVEEKERHTLQSIVLMKLIGRKVMKLEHSYRMVRHILEMIKILFHRII